MVDGTLRDEGDVQKICMDCGGLNPVWFAPNELWNVVIGGPDARGDPGGFYCPVCFIKRAEAGGIVPTAWVLTPEALSPTPPAAAILRGQIGEALGFFASVIKSGEPAQILISSWVSEAFERAYQRWRGELVSEDWGGRPWADLTGSDLLAAFYRELEASGLC